jgi:hypothetical protein
MPDGDIEGFDPLAGTENRPDGLASSEQGLPVPFFLPHGFMYTHQ